MKWQWPWSREKPKQLMPPQGGSYLEGCLKPSRLDLLHEGIYDLEQRVALVERVLTKGKVAERQEGGYWVRAGDERVWVSDSVGDEDE